MGLVLASPREFFLDRVDGAANHLKAKVLPQSKAYLVDLLQHYMFAENLMSKRETLAETFLRAQNAEPTIRFDLLKKLGDSSLYISGFFGDSLSRKLVDLDYYVDMGGAAYASLAASASDELISQVYKEYSSRFPVFVDILTFISQEAMLQSNGDLLRLYDRYLATGSRLAEEQLIEKGVLTTELNRVKGVKQ